MKIDFAATIFYTIVAICVTIAIALVCYERFVLFDKRRNNVEELYMNGYFSIGTVSRVTADVVTDVQIQGAIYYRFKTSTGIIYDNFLGSGIAKHISKTTYKLFKNRLPDIKSGDKFLVLYDEDKTYPQNSILLLDHPIESELDFERYKTEIEKNRQNKNWRGYE